MFLAEEFVSTSNENVSAQTLDNNPIPNFNSTLKKCHPLFSGDKIASKTLISDGLAWTPWELGPGDTAPLFASPNSILHLGLLEAGSAILESPSGNFRLESNRIFLLPGQSALSITSLTESKGLVVSISGGALQQARIPLGRSTTFGSLSDELDALSTQVLHCCLSTASALLASGGSTAGLHRCSSMLLTVLRDMSGAPGAKSEATVPAYVTTLEMFIQNNLTQPLTLDDLIRIAGLSPRTVQDAFRRHRGYSPMQFLRECRLRAAYEELAHPSENTSVTSTAFKWGFNHLGRFSTYFGQRFGQSPSNILRLARAR